MKDEYISTITVLNKLPSCCARILNNMTVSKKHNREDHSYYIIQNNENIHFDMSQMLARQAIIYRDPAMWGRAMRNLKKYYENRG